MAGNGVTLVKPHTAQDPNKIVPGSPLAVQGVFLEILRERFRADSGIQWIWDPDPTITGIAIEAGFNEETDTRNNAPSVYVNRLQTVPGKVIIGDRVGVDLPPHKEAFGAIVTCPIAIDVVSNDEGESAILGDTIQFMLLASQDVIQKEFGFLDFTHPRLEQTQPYERDQKKWNTPVAFEVQFWIRWSQVPIKPLLQQIVRRISATDMGAEDFFINQVIDSLARGRNQ